MKKKQASLMIQLNIAIVIITTAVLTGFGIWNYFEDMRIKKAQLEQSLTNTTNRLALNISLPLYNLDQKTIEKIIISEMHQPDIVSIHYYESWTEKIIGYLRDKSSIYPTEVIPVVPNSIKAEQVIQINDQVLGYVTVCFTLNLMKEEIRRILINDIIQILMVDVFLVILVILTLRLKVLRPIHFLTNSASEIANGKLDEEINVSGNDEIGVLASNFARMRDSIKKQIKDLRTENEIRKKAEKALRESEEKYRNVIDNSMEAICIEQNGELKYFNPESIKLFGYSEQELSQLKFKTIVYPDDRPLALDHLNNTEKGQASDGRQTYRIINKNGEIIWIENKAVTINWENSPAVLMFISDITERKRTEELIIQTEKMMSIGGLAAGMAHEINNPLSAILQGTQNIIRRLSPRFEKNVETAEELNLDLKVVERYMEVRDIPSYLKGIQDSGKRAADIISNMLQFSRKSESKIVMTNMAELVNNTIELAHNDYDLKKKYDFRKIKIVKEYDPNNERLIALCTQTEIEQVILNLLKNSAQALAKANQPDPMITVRIIRNPTDIQMDISDNGPGIEDSIQKRIFEPFYTTKPVGEGTGLGLSVSYMIITNNHQGTLEVESELGKGTTFRIRLPLERDTISN